MRCRQDAIPRPMMEPVAVGLDMDDAAGPAGQSKIVAVLVERGSLPVQPTGAGI